MVGMPVNDRLVNEVTMNINNVIAFEVKKEDRVYRLEMPHGSPLGEAYDVSLMFLAKLAELVKEHTQKQMPQDLEEEESAEHTSE